MPGPARIGGSVEGWIEWQLLDRRGRAVDGGQQHNLVLDQLLNQVPTYGLYGFMQYLCVGTGTTPPSTGQTALDAEIGRTSNNGGVTDTTTRVADGVYERTVSRLFDFAEANGNLTEWGFAAASTGALGIRELFRDGGGNPKVVTKTSAYQLRVTYKARWTLTPVVQTAVSFTIANLGAKTGKFCLTTSLGSGDPDLSCLEGIVRASTSNSYAHLLTAINNTFGYSNSGGRSTAAAKAMTAGNYTSFTPGTWSRQVQNVTWESTEGNVTIRGFELQLQGGEGWLFRFDDGQEFTKTNTNRLIITPMAGFSWNRG